MGPATTVLKMAADTKEDRVAWLKAFGSAVVDLSSW
jgi:hypothetical protein